LEPRVNWYLALTTLLITSLAAAALLGVWWVWAPEEPQTGYQRSLDEVELRWKCAAGHRFTAPGQAEPCNCPKCGAKAEIVDVYRCPEHGEFDVFVRLGPVEGTGRYAARQLRLDRGEWVSVAEGLKCPRCGRKLVRPPRDPANSFQGD